jgi:hypothetical protein
VSIGRYEAHTHVLFIDNVLILGFFITIGGVSMFQEHFIDLQ